MVIFTIRSGIFVGAAFPFLLFAFELLVTPFDTFFFLVFLITEGVAEMPLEDGEDEVAFVPFIIFIVMEPIL